MTCAGQSGKRDPAPTIMRDAPRVGAEQPVPLLRPRTPRSGRRRSAGRYSRAVAIRPKACGTRRSRRSRHRPRTDPSRRARRLGRAGPRMPSSSISSPMSGTGAASRAHRPHQVGHRERARVVQVERVMRRPRWRGTPSPSGRRTPASIGTRSPSAWPASASSAAPHARSSRHEDSGIERVRQGRDHVRRAGRPASSRRRAPGAPTFMRSSAAWRSVAAVTWAARPNAAATRPARLGGTGEPAALAGTPAGRSR